MNLVAVADIAKLLGLSPRHVRERLVNKAGFPRPRIVLSTKTRRWDMDDIQTWVEQQKKKCAR